MQRGLARALSAAKPKYDFLPLRRELHLVLCNVDKRRMQNLAEFVHEKTHARDFDRLAVPVKVAVSINT
jgi:hypothetical protein